MAIAKKSKEKSLQKKEKIVSPSHESSPIANSGYLTGWFAPDVALLSLDVITFSSTSSSAQSLTLLRLFRSLRLLRLVRMVGRAHLLKEHLTGLEFMGALASATWEQFLRLGFFGLQGRSMLSWNSKANQFFMVGYQLDDSKSLHGKWLEITISIHL